VNEVAATTLRATKVLVSCHSCNWQHHLSTCLSVNNCHCVTYRNGNYISVQTRLHNILQYLKWLS